MHEGYCYGSRGKRQALAASAQAALVARPAMIPVTCSGSHSRKELAVTRMSWV